MIELDVEERKAYLNIHAESIVTALNENSDGIDSIWHPEYAKFMLECTCHPRLNDLNISFLSYSHSS